MARLLGDGNGGQTYEDAMGANNFDEEYSKFASWSSAHGSNMKGKFSKLAFNVAQPTRMILGFMITVILMGVLLLFSFNSDWYNSSLYKAMIFILPLFVFVSSWILQYFSNMSKDGAFDGIVAYNKVVQKEPDAVNIV